MLDYLQNFHEKHRLSEEIIEYEDGQNDNFKIIPLRYICSPGPGKNFIDKPGGVCVGCFYNGLMNAFRNLIGASKLDFLIYQASQRKDPLKFYEELKSFLENYGNQIYDDKQDTQNAILDLNELIGLYGLSTKDLALKFLKMLYDKRRSISSADLEGYFTRIGLFLTENDIRWIGQYLNENSYADVAFHADGAFARISIGGIQFFENKDNIKQSDFFDNKTLDNLLIEIEKLFQQYTTDLKVENLKSFVTVEEKIDEIVEEMSIKFDNFSKPSIHRVITDAFKASLLSYFFENKLIPETVQGLSQWIQNSNI